MMRSTSSTSNTDGESSDHRKENDFDTSCNIGGLDLDEIDFESLRRVFGSASTEDLSHLKAHELRELWLKNMAEATATTTATTPSKRKKNTKAKIPRFLLPPDEEEHVAPHAVALQLLLRCRNGSNMTDGDGLYRPVASSEDDEIHDQSHHHQSSIHHSSRTNSSSSNNNKPLQGTATVLPLILIASIVLTCQFVLEVLGGAGAIWGCAEIAALRRGGASDPSWRFFTLFASAVGILCLVRFLLVHPFFPSSTDPTFAEKHKLRDLFRRSQQQGNLRLFFELVTVVARDPVLFLHPIKGPAFSSICGCYCMCCGSQWSFFENGDSGTDLDVADGSINHHSPAPLDKPSPQRSTWDMSDDDDNLNAYDNAASP